ncbi:MAG: hypothetical protein EXR27_23135 [Betaproteobacteria bacterium]|nr:hypothetical protein [Betaproteobacteria bacterium]
MSVDSRIEHLVSVAAPLWAGEAEVVHTYWTSPVRTAQTDLRWIAGQCFKEFWGSGVSKYDVGGVFFGSLKNLLAAGPQIDISVDREEILSVVETLHAEYSHYCAFANVYDAIRPAGTPKMNPHDLEGWPEDDLRTATARAHYEKFGDIGRRATRFTEGGYCTLFSEGMKLKGRGGNEEKIAAACALVYEDEFGHMLKGIAGIEMAGMGEADWQQMEALVVEQMRQRILMRNAQFSHPLPQQRIDAIFRGEIEPVRFDYEKAGLTA